VIMFSCFVISTFCWPEANRSHNPPPTVKQQVCVFGLIVLMNDLVCERNGNENINTVRHSNKVGSLHGGFFVCLFVCLFVHKQV
jgi:hypothetical protein